MTRARCVCGTLSLLLPEGPPLTVVACHCIDCQRRTGSAFGVGAFYAMADVAFSGAATEFARPAESGGIVQTYFCPTCGSTVYWTAANLPGIVGIALGAIEGLDTAGPARSIFERSRHGWVDIHGAHVQHLRHGSAHAT